MDINLTENHEDFVSLVQDQKTYRIRMRLWNTGEVFIRTQSTPLDRAMEAASFWVRRGKAESVEIIVEGVGLVATFSKN